MNVRETLRIQIPYEPITLDPTLAEDGVALQILHATSRGLMGYDGNGRLQKELAKNYQISPDGKKYEFDIDPQAKWSDGQPVLAQNFVAAFQRMLDPLSVCKLLPLFTPIRGAKNYHSGQGSLTQLGVYAKEGKGRKLVIELEVPIPYFLHALTLPPSFPQREDILSSHQGRWPEHAPVTGLYRIASHQLEQCLTLEKITQEGSTSAGISKIEFKIVSDESTAMALFEQGRLDLLTRLSSFDFQRLKKKGHVKTFPFLATYYLSFNTRQPPFNNPHWRRAVAGVIQRQEVVQTLDSGETPAWSWIPKGLEGYLPYQDPKKYYINSIETVSRQKKGSELIVAAFDTGARNSRIMEKIQEDLIKNLGVRVSLMHMDWKTYLQTIQRYPPAIFRMGQLAPFWDPMTHLKVFTRGNPNNFSGWSNDQYDRLVGEIERLPSGPERESRIQKAQKILLDEAVVVPLYHYVQNTGVLPRVHHFVMNPFGMISFQDLVLE